MPTKHLSACALVLFACSSKGTGVASDPSNQPGWQPVDPSQVPSTCGAAIAPTAPPPRPSSLRLGSCGFCETHDFAVLDLLCAPGTQCGSPQIGAQLCHRGGDDIDRAGGETCGNGSRSLRG